MKARLVGVCLLLGLAIALAGCGGGDTAVAPPATPSPRKAATTTTRAPVATQVQAVATATATVAPAAPATATSGTEMTAATVTATATSVPPTSTATAAPSTAMASPTQTTTKAVESSTASLTVNGQSINYSYPNGWRLKQETKDRYSVVSLEGPDGALLTLTMYGMDMEPAQLSATLLDTMKKQFGGATVTTLKGTVAGIAAEGYSMTFTYLGVPMTSAILSFRGGKSSFTLYTQAAAADLSAVQSGFDLIKNTLVVK